MSFFKIKSIFLQSLDDYLMPWETFLAETLYAIDKSSPWKCKFWDLPLLALKFTRFHTSFLEPRVSFFWNFSSLCSVMRHKTSVLFDLSLCMLSTKRTYQRTIFTASECSNESSHISSCNLWSHKVRIYLNFASLFSLIKDNSSVFFSSKLTYFGQKKPIEVKILNFCVVG